MIKFCIKDLVKLMKESETRLVAHLDINSAYLSYMSAYHISKGATVDYRDICSVVGGSENSRHGIVLAKSKIAKNCGVSTGETLYQARKKCTAAGYELLVVPPDYSVFIACSNQMVEILNRFSDRVARFSIDECFVDFTGMENLYPDIVDTLYTIKEAIKNEVGVTCSVGLSSNKLLAKMASDLKKDGVETLFPNEIKRKMWPLPVQDLFMVGQQTLKKLNSMGIYTIGELARYDLDTLKYRLKSQGELVWKYANGIENSQVKKSNFSGMKGMGNSTTINFDIDNKEEANLVIMSLCETIGMRLRSHDSQCNLVSLYIRYSDFRGISRQRKFKSSTDITSTIANIAFELFCEVWDGMPVRHLGVYVSYLSDSSVTQITLFDDKDIDKKKNIDKCVDSLRERFGSKSVMKCCFLNSGVRPISGGIGESDYPIMTSIL
jgi:DNA polymerase-4